MWNSANPGTRSINGSEREYASAEITGALPTDLLMCSMDNKSDTDRLPDTAILLAGGLGTRLSPMVPDRPKVLAPAAGRPFLDYLLTYLAAQGTQRVILSIGYLAEQIRTFASDGRQWGIEIEYSQEDEPLGTGGALRLASERLTGGAFFALNAVDAFVLRNYPAGDGVRYIQFSEMVYKERVPAVFSEGLR